MEEAAIDLGEAIRSLRAELSSAMAQGEGQDLRFRVGPVELEFDVQVSREAGAEGGVKFWVVSAGAKATTGTATTHRVKIALQPQTADGKDVAVSQGVARRPA